MAASPVVSIITALYNCEAYVGESIRSVQEQSMPDWEMIIVDDGSSDDSREVVKSYLKKDSRLKLVPLHKNLGPAVARNTGIELARGRYIAFLDSDDQWLPRKLEKQLYFMSTKNCGITHTEYRIVTDSGIRTPYVVSPPGKLTYDDMLKSNKIGCLTVIYDSNKLGKVYMPSIRKRQDYGLWLKLLKREEVAWCVPEVLALYRNRTDSVSRNKMDMLRYNWRVYREFEKFSVIRSGYYLSWNIASKLSEYWMVRGLRAGSR